MIRRHLRFIITILAVASFAMPAASQAGCHKKMHSCGCGGKGGIIFNQHDNMWYRVPDASRNVVYRGVDQKLVPVAKYGCKCSCKTNRCYHKTVGVSCKMMPGYWWSTTWMAPSQECRYVR